MNKFEFSKNDAIEAFRQISRIRSIETTIAVNYFPNVGTQQMRCPVHLSIGQEASAVSVCQQLNEEDQLYSTHRSHAHLLARGGDVYKFFCELLGRQDGLLMGRGGSMHLKDLSVNFMMSVPIVGSVFPLGVGAAFAKKVKNQSGIVVIFFGDGSLEEGIWHEAANFAALRELPVLFVCENNLYSVYSKLEERQPSGDLNRLAVAHGIEVLETDGNKIDVASAAAASAVEYVRTKNKPFFLNLLTYRYLEHCGPNDDDHLSYRPSGELAYWMTRDPLLYSRELLLHNFNVSVQDIQSIEEANKNFAEKTFKRALQAEFPNYSSIKDYEYFTGEGPDN